MKFKTLLGAMFVLALILTACAPATTPTTAPTLPPATEPPTTEPATTETTEATEPATEPAATGSPAADTTATSGIPVTGEATVEVAESAEFGSYLVDGEGMALYAFMGDTQDAGTSTCADDCAAEWPPLASQGSPVAGDGVDATLLSTITRDDGTMQVTYNGWPLYTFVEDAAPGDTNGQGLEDEFGQWFLVSPEGEPIQ